MDKKKKIGESIVYNIDSRVGYFDSNEIKTLEKFTIDDGVLVFYYTETPFFLGASLFDKNDTTKLLYRTASPIWSTNTIIEDLKIKLDGQNIILSFSVDKEKKSETFSLNFILGKESKNIQIKKTIRSLIEKVDCNPIIKPNSNKWESCGTFNPAVLELDGKVYILYRAVGGDLGSVIGCAISNNGIDIDERLDYPIYQPIGNFELKEEGMLDPTFPYCSGSSYNSWGGCEDPRIAKIGDTVYMIYTAFNGINPPRVALTSIKVSDFVARNWNKWKKPVLVSPENQMNKNWVIFPEKINGKYAIIHSITPNIQIEYLDNLEFKENPNKKSKYVQVKNKDVWDSVIRGVGPTPIKTDDGWLVFYHAISENEPGKYKIGAMILDYKDPTKVLYKSSFPIIEPSEIYENEGFKGGIVYTCGAIVKDRNLLLYYGGADTVVCVASCNLENFIKQIKDNNAEV